MKFAKPFFLALATAALFCTALQADEITVLRNALDVRPYANVHPYPYMNCEDTRVSKDSPDANFGGSRQLVLIPGESRILIKFTQLNRALGVNRNITRAALVLVPLPGGMRSSDSRITIAPLKSDWGEGSADGQPNYWGASWNQRLSSAKGNGRDWNKPGLAASADFAPQFTEVVPLAAMKPLGEILENTGVDLTEKQKSQSALVIESDRLREQVRNFYYRNYTNFGWVIDVAAGANAGDHLVFHSSQSKDLAFRPMLIIESETGSPPPNDMDITVTYIERTPEYLRYAPNDPGTGKEVYEYKSYHGKDDMAGILKDPIFKDEKKWPDEGEKVTFTAHVKNAGRDKDSGPIVYKWLINDEQVDSGKFDGDEGKGIEPGKETAFSIDWKWHADHADHRDQTVTFSVEPADPNVREVTKNNNQLTDFIEALNLGYYFDDHSYQAFSRVQNGFGSYCPEDWVQWQWNMWNDTVMARSKYPSCAPDGCLERVRLQRITICPDGKLSPYGNHIPDGKSNFYYDGEWGTDRAPERYSQPTSKVFEGGLIHENTHQIGVIDNYWSNMDGSNEKGEGGKVHFELPGGLFLTRMYWDWDGGIMGGGHTRFAPGEPPYGGQFYSAVTCAGLNSSLGYRRGFFGDYTYDLPEKLTLIIQDWAGRPIPDAKVTVFQSAAAKLTNEWPVVSGKTDSQGRIVVPPQPIMEDKPVTLATGHTLRPNPWGRVNVVGGNMVFLIRVEKGDQTGYRFLKSLEANVAYWGGAKDNWNCPMKFAICQEGIGKDNIAKGASVASSNVSMNGATAMNDGDVKTAWNSSFGKDGFFEIDLGDVKDVGRILWIGGIHTNFDICISETGSFRGEEKLFFSEPDIRTYIAEHNDPCPEDPKLRMVPFTGRPTKGRYIRFIPTREGGFTINELRIHESNN